ncbi:MAG: hypothetical protein SFY92_07525 [Verrucomicrobiae bacterium]|nr:hypothetical protein [Verrucomicrobiae bacterium]
MRQAPQFITHEEIEAHLYSMPTRYWEGLTEQNLNYHLRLINSFFESLVTSNAEVPPPTVQSRHFEDEGYTEVIVASWDRMGLFAKIAGAFACADINIKRAFIYTRADHVVLDVFHVTAPTGGHVHDESCLIHMKELLAECLDGRADLDLEKLMVEKLKKRGYPTSRFRPTGPAAPVISWDNQKSAEETILKIECDDSLGLLYAILQELSDQSVDVHMANIDTVRNTALDVFYITDKFHKKITHQDRLREVQNSLIRKLSSRGH